MLGNKCSFDDGGNEIKALENDGERVYHIKKKKAKTRSYSSLVRGEKCGWRGEREWVWRWWRKRKRRRRMIDGRKKALVATSFT